MKSVEYFNEATLVYFPDGELEHFVMWNDILWHHIHVYYFFARPV